MLSKVRTDRRTPEILQKVKLVSHRSVAALARRTIAEEWCADSYDAVAAFGLQGLNDNRGLSTRGDVMSPRRYI